MTSPADTAPSWREAIFNRRMLVCVFTGLASGMPLYVLIQLVPAWLRNQGVSLAEIGLFALVGIPYTWKFLWAPLMDRYVPPFLGRRRGWMLVTQVVLLLSIGMLGVLQPQQSLTAVATVAFIVALFSASQDVVLDGYRREILPDEELGLGNSIHVQAYRISSLVPGSLSLVLADHLPWSSVFWITGTFMLVGVAMCIAVSEPESELPPASGIRQAVVAPFAEYLQRRRLGGVVLVLSFMLFYKLGDSMATALSTPFYIDLGFSMTEIGLVAKHAALWPSIIGGLVGGVLMIRLGINRALWLFGLLQLMSIFGFAILAEAGQVLWLLAAVISFEYLGVGMGTAAFTAFIARETSRAFAATQFALFTAITALPRTFANASTGVIVEAVGWTEFFLLCATIALPGMVLLLWVAPWNGREVPTRSDRKDAAEEGPADPELRS
ncbi:MAG: AmpG family muropeptide MFS transporter [Halieaceae bacterium]|jgi:PAT family beta-lactamase induction signal transducer AmpG|nr:AmpG family muropeptide MFS transporter [Halieaceae bacterium]